METQRRRIPWLAASIALLAVAVIGSGTGAADAAGSVLSIIDKRTKVAAKVYPGGRLSVGDRSGPLTVDGRVRVSDGSGPVTVDGRVGSALPTSVLLKASTDPGVSAGVACSFVDVDLPAGVPVLVQQVSAHFQTVRASESPRADVNFLSKVGGQQVTHRLPIPLDDETGFGYAAGAVETDVVVKGATFGAAAEGQVYGMQVCFNRGTSSSTSVVGHAIVFGRR